MKYLVLKILKLYKQYFSTGRACRFYPTCSVYTYMAVEKYGVIKGMYLGVRRLLRCNPWSKGGVDMVD